MKKIYFLPMGILLAVLSLSLFVYIQTNYKNGTNQNPTTVGLANPASVNCTKVGGRSEMQTLPNGGQYSLCYFDDNKACEEWSLLRGDCPIGGVKTTGYDTADQKFCAWSGGTTVAESDSKCTFKNGKICSTLNFYNGTCTSADDSISLTDKNVFYNIAIKYPNETKDTKQTMKAYAEYMFSQKKTDWKIGGDVYNEEQKLAKDFPDRPKTAYEYITNFEERESQKLGTVSYKFDSYEFTGGAHGNNTIATFNFGKSGKIELEDVINLQNNNDIAISKLIAQKVLSNKDLGGYTEVDMVNDGLGLNYLDKNGKFDKAKCKCDGFFFGSNLQNFIIADTGLTFIMNKYQVSPGSSGNPEIKFTWSELRTFMNPKFDLPLD